MSRERLWGVTVATIATLAIATTGCAEVTGRGLVQEGNELYKRGNYLGAIEKFDEAAAYVPELPQLWINKGYTCRQLIVPGVTDGDSGKGIECAKEALTRYQELVPKDERGEQLFVQTLFDADDFDALSKMFKARYEKSPNNIQNIETLKQVYSRWARMDGDYAQDAIDWYAKAAELKADDAETQYSVGAYIWQLLHEKGGSDLALHQFRPEKGKTPPALDPDGIIRQQRVDYADMGLAHLKRAVEIRADYFEALTYLNLLNRQKALGLFDDPKAWEASILAADEWRAKATELFKKRAAAKAAKEAKAKGEDPEAAAAAIMGSNLGAGPEVKSPAAGPRKGGKKLRKGKRLRGKKLAKRSKRRRGKGKKARRPRKGGKPRRKARAPR